MQKLICSHFVLSHCFVSPRSLTFKVGDKPVSNFRMIERHYYKDTLIKSYDFNFVFCPPNSCNGWDAEYEFPELDDALSTSISPL